MSYMRQNKKRKTKQTFESAEYGLEIIFEFWFHVPDGQHLVDQTEKKRERN